MDLKDYQSQTLVEVAYKALKKDITERVLLPGQKMILREIHERYGISETPIKQALNRLIAEGIVESIPRRGMRVRTIQWEEIEELMDIRLMIETYYLERVMQTFHNEAGVKETFSRILMEHWQIINHVTDVDDYFKNYYLDQEFHQLFVECSKNKRILQIYNNLGTHAYSYYVYGRQGKEGMIAGVKEHEDIYNALLARDEDILRKGIEIHIINAKNNVHQMLDKNKR